MQVLNQTSKERPCPACSATAYTHFANEHIDVSRVNDFTYSSRKQPEFMCLRLVRCTNCDLVYAPTPPDTTFLSTAYAEAAYDSGEEAQCAARSYGRALAPYFNQFAQRKGAVDVGAGSGPLLPWLTDFGFHPVLGVEPSRAAIEAAPAAVRALLREGMFTRELLADIPPPSLICSFMTLEHLSDPGEFVKTAYDLLEPGGMIAVVVHNWKGWLNRSLGLRSPIIDVEHLQLFDPKSVDILLKGAGFTNIEVKAISNAYPMKYWLRLTPLPSGIKVAIGKALTSTFLVDRKIPLRVGNLLAVGFKPFA